MDKTTNNTDSPQVAGLLAEFDGPKALKAAAAAVREAGYTRFEAYSPFPVHGIDAAMGRRRTRLPWLVLGGGMAGGIGALLLQWWTNATSYSTELQGYPFVISGKPLFSLPASIPVAFELIILLAALAAFVGGLALSGLPEFFHPLFRSAKFRRVSTDAFCLSIEAADPKFDESATAEFLQSVGAGSSEVILQPASQRKLPGLLTGGVAVLMALALLPPLAIATYRYTKKTSPRLHPIADMDAQPNYLPQQASPLFADGRAMRLPIAGTIAVDQDLDDDHLLLGQINGQPATTFPMPVTPDLMQRGRERYDIFCATCHGLAGDGDGMTSKRAWDREEPKWVRPLSIHIETVRQQPVGQLFQTITKGGSTTMPSYASQIPVRDRWAIVLYLRALQRTRNATLDDIPDEQQEIRKQLEQQMP